MGLLVFASTVAVNAIFSLAAIGMGASFPLNRDRKESAVGEQASERLTLSYPPDLRARPTDSSYLFAIVACMIWRNHPEGETCLLPATLVEQEPRLIAPPLPLAVMFKPGPFHLGWGFLGWSGTSPPARVLTRNEDWGD